MEWYAFSYLERPGYKKEPIMNRYALALLISISGDAAIAAN